MFLGGFDSHTVHKHINLSTCTAVSNGLSYIQFLGAGSRMLRSVFYSQLAKRETLRGNLCGDTVEP